MIGVQTFRSIFIKKEVVLVAGKGLCKIKGRHAVTMSFGSGCTLALQYRWKGFEKAAAWVHRNRSCHKLLDAALRQVWKGKDTRLNIL